MTTEQEVRIRRETRASAATVIGWVLIVGAILVRPEWIYSALMFVTGVLFLVNAELARRRIGGPSLKTGTREAAPQ